MKQFALTWKRAKWGLGDFCLFVLALSRFPREALEFCRVH